MQTGHGEGTNAEIEDDGQSVRVRCGESTRAFADPQRRCSERAKAVAVYLALLLAPPAPPPDVAVKVETPPSLPPPPAQPTLLVPAKAPPPTVAAVPIPQPATRSVGIAVEVAGVVEVAPSAGSQTLGGGAEARLIIGGRRLAFALGIGALSQGSVSVASGTAQLSRFPIDLGLQGILGRGRFEGLLDVAPVLSIIVAQGEGFAHNAGAIGVDLGARVAFGGRYWIADRLALVATIEARFVALPAQLRVDPAGVTAPEPTFWIGASLGLAVRLR